MTSITMLVHDRHRLTEQALVSLYANTDPKTFTLTIVDDGSQDFRTTRLLERYAADNPRNLALIRLSNSRGITGQARNLAIYWSWKFFGKSDWLYLSDNDVWYSPGWLEKLTSMAEFLEPSGYVLFGGQVHPYHQPLKQPHFSGAWMDGSHADPLVEWSWHAMLDGPSWMMRWKTWRKHGPLDAHAPGVCQGEDVTFCNAIVAAGERIAVTHPHVVAHTGLRQSNGNLAPGADARMVNAISGVLYE